MMKNKKGVVAFLLTPIGIVISIVAVLIILGLLGGLAVFLTFNALTVAGLVLVIVASVIAVRVGVSNTVIGIGVMGIILLLIPMLTNTVSGFTLAALVN